MKYLCLVYSEEKQLEAVPDNGCVAYDAALRESLFVMRTEIPGIEGEHHK